MLRYKILLTTVIFIFAVHAIKAQSHNNAWFRGTVSYATSRKLKVDTEFQHRRQNGLDNKNSLDKNLMFTVRNWIHYQQSNTLKFSVSPFAYFFHNKIIKSKADMGALVNREIRFSAAVELQHKFSKKWYIIDRNAVEYRIFKGSQSEISRFRNLLGLRYDFTDKFKLKVFDEFFFNMKDTGIDHFFDQNRVGVNLEYNTMHNLKFDVGYIYLNRLPVSDNNVFTENNVFVNLTYKLGK